MASNVRKPMTLGDAIVLLDNYAAVHADNPAHRRAITEVTAARLFNLHTRNVRVTE